MPCPRTDYAFEDDEARGGLTWVLVLSVFFLNYYWVVNWGVWLLFVVGVFYVVGVCVCFLFSNVLVGFVYLGLFL